MKPNGLQFVLLTLALFASSGRLCGEEEQTPPNILRSKDLRIEIELPRSYSEKTPTRPLITLLATDDAKATTIIVISENQSQFDSLAQYADIVRGRMCQSLRDAQCDGGHKLDVGGHPAIRYEITGISANGLRMGFHVTLIQTETRYNQVIGSCVRTHFADRKTEFANIAANLKELPLKKVAERKPD